MQNALIRSKQVRLDMRYRTGKALVREALKMMPDLEKCASPVCDVEFEPSGLDIKPKRYKRRS